MTSTVLTARLSFAVLSKVFAVVGVGLGAVFDFGFGYGFGYGYGFGSCF